MIKLLPLFLLTLIAFVVMRAGERRTQRLLAEKSLPLTDPAITRIADRMAEALEVTGVNVVMTDDSSVSSLSFPDGSVALSRGLVMLKMRGMITAEELMAVVAHELGRSALGVSRQRFQDFLVEQGHFPLFLRGPLPALNVATSWAANLFFATRLAERRRKAVFEADAWATALLLKIDLGAAPQTSVLRVLDQLADYSPKDGLSDGLALLPTYAERIAAIEANAARWVRKTQIS